MTGTTPAETLTADLAPGETALWRGRPYQGRRWGLTQIVGAIVGGLALASAAPNLLRADGDLFSLLPALIGVGFGAACLVAAFVHEPRRRRRTRYALTERRGFVERPGLFSAPRLTWRAIEADSYLDLADHGDGLGTVWFHRHAWRPHGERHERVEFTGFQFIPDAPEVHAMIAAIQARRRAEAAARTGAETGDDAPDA